MGKHGTFVYILMESSCFPPLSILTSSDVTVEACIFASLSLVMCLVGCRMERSNQSHPLLLSRETVTRRMRISPVDDRLSCSRTSFHFHLPINYGRYAKMSHTVPSHADGEAYNSDFPSTNKHCRLLDTLSTRRSQCCTPGHTLSCRRVASYQAGLLRRCDLAADVISRRFPTIPWPWMSGEWYHLVLDSQDPWAQLPHWSTQQP